MPRPRWPGLARREHQVHQGFDTGPSRKYAAVKDESGQDDPPRLISALESFRYAGLESVVGSRLSS